MLAKKLRRKLPKGGQKSYSQIAAELFALGHANRTALRSPSPPSSRCWRADFPDRASAEDELEDTVKQLVKRRNAREDSENTDQSCAIRIKINGP